VLRRLRSLHGRDDAETPYGSYLATHLAIGALFLGNGTATFGTGNVQVASLLLSFYPIWPMTVSDNRSHLQAFRHFWCLAAEDRCLVVRDIATECILHVAIRIGLRDGGEIRLDSPGLGPPLDTVQWVRTDAGQGFWDVELDLSQPAGSTGFDQRGGPRWDMADRTTNNTKDVPTVADAFRQNLTIYLRRRPAEEAPFSSTLSALGQESFDEGGRAAEVTPLETIFKLPALRAVSYGERSAVLDCDSGGTIVDTRLELDESVHGARASRDDLLGLKLLFSWGDRRDVLEREERRRATGGRERPGATGGVEEEGQWWLRSSVIEGLKGRVWLAGSAEE
jgi:anaphase-promoting complex subunit 1